MLQYIKGVMRTIGVEYASEKASNAASTLFGSKKHRYDSGYLTIEKDGEYYDIHRYDDESGHEIMGTRKKKDAAKKFTETILKNLDS